MSVEPELRDGPPWAMEEMILAEPGLVAPIFALPEIVEAAEWIRETETVTVTGCGTSEHAAQAGAALLGGKARARDAFEASLDPQPDGVLIAVSHEAGTPATRAAIKATSARTILITARPEVETGADLTIATPLVDTSWCHTVGYMSPLLALTALANAADASTCSQVIEDTLAQRPKLEHAAHTLAGCARLIAVGSGVDEITARELALKIEEATHVPTTPLGIEKVLHGHLPAADATTGVVIVRADRTSGAERDRRAENVRAAVAGLGMPAVTIDGLPSGHALLAGALALQLLTYELALALGTNPDLIRREEPAYRAAAAAAGAG